MIYIEQTEVYDEILFWYKKTTKKLLCVKLKLLFYLTLLRKMYEN